MTENPQQKQPPVPKVVLECPTCGARMDLNTEKCPFCGEEFVKQLSKGGEFECPECGSNISDDMKKCPTCGTEFLD